MGSPSVARGSRPRGAVAAFTWNQGQRSPGMGGRLAMESGAAFVWNRWQLCRGIRGSLRVESPAALPWNQWQVWRGIRIKPRKRKKGRRKAPPVTHKVELQALAIREKKIYLQALPTLSRQPVALFMDMEGVPDRGFYYLIGLLVCQGDTTEHHAFWADTDQDERHIWQQFVAKVQQYPDAPIYHYGSYEPRAIAILAKRYETDAESVTKRLVNVNRYIYGKVYFPVRSNGLKDIGHCIGAQWTSPQASGLQSLVWRHYWEHTQDATYRDELVLYNTEDCYALKLLLDELSRIALSAESLSEVDFADKRKQPTTEMSGEIHSQFGAILRSAHF